MHGALKSQTQLGLPAKPLSCYFITQQDLRAEWGHVGVAPAQDTGWAWLVRPRTFLVIAEGDVSAEDSTFMRQILPESVTHRALH